MPVRIAFHAPMKSPDHPTPSGDRQIARLTLRALEMAGFSTFVASALRVLDMTGKPGLQAELTALAQNEATRLVGQLEDDPPGLWFTYHCYYKAPDLLGPRVSAALNIPYVISEPSLATRRRVGPWADFAHASEAALAAAQRLFWTTRRDLPALRAAGLGARLIHLPAFLDAGPAPASRAAGTPLKLLTVAMMRPGDKLESYRRLARALDLLEQEWTLQVIGDGPVRHEVEVAFSSIVDRVSFAGTLDDGAAIRAACERADLLVWPGVGEGVGMVYLEAQAAGLPVVAEDHAAQRDVVFTDRAPPDDAAAFAALIGQCAADRAALSARVRNRIEAGHSLASAAKIFRDTLGPLTG